MDRFKDTFEKLKLKKRSAFIPFTMVGDPDYKTSLDIVKVFADNGADMIELGMPFSDPVADGPINQRAGLRSLEAGMNTAKMFQFIKDIRKFTNIPIGLLCYYNNVLSFNTDKFYKEGAKAGLDTILVADAAIEEANHLINASEKSGVKTVFIISELSDNARILKTASKTTGFIYLVARLGVTGVQKKLEDNTIALYKKVKKVSKSIVCIGFGISKPEHVKKLSKEGVDGIICGSAIVKIIEDGLKNKKDMLNKLKRFIINMRRATNGR